MIDTQGIYISFVCEDMSPLGLVLDVEIVGIEWRELELGRSNESCNTIMYCFEISACH